MFSNDQETYEALNSLTSIAQEQSKPLLIWVGAGVSTWAGYPFWLELAAKMHTNFSREVRNYDKEISSQLLTESKYPELFEQMRIANQPRYFTFLSEQFRPKNSNGVYLRFIRALRKFPSVSIVTTNVDEALEHNLPEHETVQSSDIERLPQLLHQKIPFICKLHGSASSVESMVFSKRDYETIQQNNIYLDAVRSIFTNATVLFLGYGLRDEYVIQCLIASSSERPLFGSGPHFIVTAEERIDLPSEVRRIRYAPEAADHRDAIQALEVISEIPKKHTIAHVEKSSVRESIYYIANLFPIGKWETSQTLNVQSSSGLAHQVIIGEGYIDEEIIFHNYSALHDIVIGLLCFDIVYVSIDYLSHVHDLLGFEAFWLFVRSGSLRLVIPPSTPVIIFTDDKSPLGNLSGLNLGSQNSSLGEFASISISERIRRKLAPANGKEFEAEELFRLLELSAIDASEAHLSDTMPARTVGALMNPLIRNMLGISHGTPRNVMPRWVAFPILRLAGVMSSGIICQHIHANSTRMIFGSEKLASIAFSATDGKEWADEAASYVLTGRFNSDVGSIIEQEPRLLLGILKFRESIAGEDFRREVAERLSTDDGSQIVTAINAGLKHSLPTSALQKARDQLSGLFIPRNSASEISPAVWGDLRNSDLRIATWRKRSRALLNEEIKRQKLTPYDNCPCGSGEKLKFCCLAALS